jgi:hypothetical protein
MPTPKQHEDHAARQRAYRQRLAAASSEQNPAAPKIPATAGKRRWAAQIDAARQLLESARDGMQEYYDDRSEAWQDGERAEEMQTTIDALEAVLEQFEELV